MKGREGFSWYLYFSGASHRPLYWGNLKIVFLVTTQYSGLTLLAILHQYSQGYWGHRKEEPFVWGSFRYDIIFPQPLLPSVLIHLTLAYFLSVGKIKWWWSWGSFHLDLLILLEEVNKSLLLSVWLALLIDQVKTGSFLCQISAENKVVIKVKFFSGRSTLRGARETLSRLRVGSSAGVEGPHNAHCLSG